MDALRDLPPGVARAVADALVRGFETLLPPGPVPRRRRRDPDDRAPEPRPRVEPKRRRTAEVTIRDLAAWRALAPPDDRQRQQRQRQRPPDDDRQQQRPPDDDRQRQQRQRQRPPDDHPPPDDDQQRRPPPDDHPRRPPPDDHPRRPPPDDQQLRLALAENALLQADCVRLMGEIGAAHADLERRAHLLRLRDERVQELKNTVKSLEHRLAWSDDRHAHVRAELRALNAASPIGVRYRTLRACLGDDAAPAPDVFGDVEADADDVDGLRRALAIARQEALGRADQLERERRTTRRERATLAAWNERARAEARSLPLNPGDHPALHALANPPRDDDAAWRRNMTAGAACRSLAEIGLFSRDDDPRDDDCDV